MKFELELNKNEIEIIKNILGTFTDDDIEVIVNRNKLNIDKDEAFVSFYRLYRELEGIVYED